tara:strand:+ start:859 stop:1515 length:657 start_codon:yes stop_codon:yes gene_type:complete
MARIVLVYSGGLDSFTLLNHSMDLGHEVFPITFNYGQKHIKEITYAANFCKEESLSLKLIDITEINSLLEGSALTDILEVPKGHYEDDSMKTTVVPNRNMILISLATAYAVTINADEVWYGAHGGDHAIYPDCRPEFVNKINETTLVANYSPISVKAPFINLSKDQILSLGIRLNLDYSKTWTCYEGKELACGECGSCMERLEAFTNNQLEDPLTYQS